MINNRIFMARKKLKKLRAAIWMDENYSDSFSARVDMIISHLDRELQHVQSDIELENAHTGTGRPSDGG